MSNLDLETLIEDAVTDIELPADTLDTPEDPSPEPLEAAQDDATPTPDPTPSETPEVPSPASKAPTETTVEDAFGKRFGLTAQSSSGRENRIPYTRVKKITEKAEKDAEARIRKEFDGFFAPAKYQELEAKVKDYEPKLKDYETRLAQVAEFEQIMVSDADRFIGMLKQIPIYQDYFSKLAQPQTEQAPPPDPNGDMPLPDQELPDGSRVYSMDGLKKLQEWQMAKAEERAYARISKEYAPIRESFETYQRTQAVLPKVQQEIAEARKWELFNESEGEIVKSLQAHPTWTLHQAYQAVVIPKLKAKAEEAAQSAKVDREKVRAEVLAELKKAPRATSTTVPSVKSTPAPTTGGSLEDVIAASISGLK